MRSSILIFILILFMACSKKNNAVLLVENNTIETQLLRVIVHSKSITKDTTLSSQVNSFPQRICRVGVEGFDSIVVAILDKNIHHSFTDFDCDSCMFYILSINPSDSVIFNEQTNTFHLHDSIKVQMNGYKKDLVIK